MVFNPRLNPKWISFSSYHDEFFGFCFCPDEVAWIRKNRMENAIYMVRRFKLLRNYSINDTR